MAAGRTDSRSIVVRCPNWIGDAVIAVAALRELRRSFPQDSISLVARGWVAGLYQGQDLGDHVITLPQRSTFKGALALRRNPSHFDQAILLPNSFATAAEAWLARIPIRMGYGRDGRSLLLTHTAVPRLPRNRHQAFYYLDLIFQLGLSRRDYLDSAFEPDIRLTVPPGGTEGAMSLLRSAGWDGTAPLLVINPGAHYGSAKRWFPDRYARVAENLHTARGFHTVLVGSRAEVLLAESIASLMRAPNSILTGQTDLASLMGVIKAAALMLTNDSGPMHLGAALGTPLLALFGSTDEIATGPLSRQALVIHKHAECSPCLLRECPLDLRCFARIGVDEVSEAAINLFDGKARQS